MVFGRLPGHIIEVGTFKLGFWQAVDRDIWGRKNSILGLVKPLSDGGSNLPS